MSNFTFVMRNILFWRNIWFDILMNFVEAWLNMRGEASSKKIYKLIL